jgi:hypothetical protein
MSGETPLPAKFLAASLYALRVQGFPFCRQTNPFLQFLVDNCE